MFKFPFSNMFTSDCSNVLDRICVRVYFLVLQLSIGVMYIFRIILSYCVNVNVLLYLRYNFKVVREFFWKSLMAGSEYKRQLVENVGALINYHLCGTHSGCAPDLLYMDLSICVQGPGYSWWWQWIEFCASRGYLLFI